MHPIASKRSASLSGEAANGGFLNALTIAIVLVLVWAGLCVI
jgi:hypothetical protein